MVPQLALHIGCDDPDVAVADAIDSAHGRQFPEGETIGFWP